jgi:hypothetical protein
MPPDTGPLQVKIQWPFKQHVAEVILAFPLLLEKTSDHHQHIAIVTEELQLPS